ncbi:CHAT domain-containing protein [Pseudanabaena sp. ABRG5-3]|uniref:CHAT domain-containing protein n=1 Tax=Pseudanabaena sp. ABRG5-3 TaxID=685565 RepID=UPI000DC72C9D|nr:tetratricopeptide repeat protein [Pseudanabaena sp. ABRG5-3]BBC25473.1 tetratricopeptide [Pseudanabaena sp. ABRG5-3]
MSKHRITFRKILPPIIITTCLACTSIPISQDDRLLAQEKGSITTPQDQTILNSKIQAERLREQARTLYQAKQYPEALKSLEQALQIYRSLKDRSNEAKILINLGQVYRSLKDSAKAIAYYQQALEIAIQIADLQSQSNVLNSLGNVYNFLGQKQKAIEFYQQSLAIAEQTSESVCANLPKDKSCIVIRDIQRNSLNGLGNVHNSLGQYQKAIDFYQQSLAIAKQMGKRQWESLALGNLGNTYDSIGQHQKAIELFHQSLAIARQISDRDGEGTILLSLGNAYNSLGKYQEAINFYQQSLVIAKQLRDQKSVGSALGNLGSTYNSLGQYQKAIEFFQQSLVIDQKLGDRQGEGITLGNLGNAYYYLGQYQKAIEFYQQSLAIAQQTNNRHSTAIWLNNLGNVHNSLGQYQKALDFYQKSLEITKQIGDLKGEGKLLGNLGNAYYYLQQYPKAIQFYQQSLASAKQIGDRQNEGAWLNNLGVAYHYQKQYLKAIEFYQQSLNIYQEIGDREGLGSVLTNLGSAYTISRQYPKALNYYYQALATVQQIGDRYGESATLKNLGYLFTAQQQPELAILFYKRSINISESIRKDIRGLPKTAQQSYLETVADGYKRLADLLIKQGRVMEALQVIDLLKFQELEDYLKNIKGSDRSAQGVRLLEPEKAISDKLLAVSFENSKEINRQLANKIQQLPKSEINKVPDYLQKIPQGTALLYPLILGDRIEIILFSPNTTPISRTVKISQKELENLVIDFRAALLDASNEDVKKPAAQLYKLLIKPIETELVQAKATTILYAPDGQLRYIPIAALYDGKQWLAEKYRISNLIAYSLFDFSTQPKNSPNILAGAFGGKSGERKFGQTALPATVKEIQAIANSFQNSVTLTEENFSRQAIESKFKNHNILHLATHAEFNTGTPDNSFIIFGNGDKIRLNEITDWQIPNIDLIVLSACQTGVGKLGDGVEILGFGYQVQKAGAKNAIASLWSVNDEGTQALMEAFYRELKKGDITPTEALNRAQVTLIKSPKYNHPNYWSAFFAIGNGL